MTKTTVAAALCAVIGATPAAARCWKGETVSWYGEPQRLSNGDRFDPTGQTCAHRTAPRGSTLRVTDLDTGRSVDCLVNDFGPLPWTRCLVDLSRRSAERLGIIHRGVARARVEVLR